ncbi:MAG: FAD-dependent oxidoreductase, partial [Clostridia bacterium]
YEMLGYQTSGLSNYHPELKKRVLENRFWAAGGTIAYEADLAGVLMEAQNIIGIEYLDDGGLHTACATIVIDASAEAYVCLLAGASYRLGRDSDRKTQPFSCVEVTCDDATGRMGHAYSDCGYVNPIDPVDYAKAVLSAARYPNYLREDYRKGIRTLGLSSLLGVREGPLVDGEDMLTLTDVLAGKKSEKPLFIAYSNADNHGKDMAFESIAQQDWMVAASLWGLNFSVGVPVGAVIPKGLNGLLMAGRMISVDHDLASCIRMERDIQKCGEAVGMLASEALRHGCAVRSVPYASLAAMLRQTGCLSEANAVGFVDSRIPNGQGRIAFPQRREDILAGLSSDQPGMAIWSARTQQLREPLFASLGSEKEHLRCHAAMALALQGDDTGAEVLRTCVRNFDAFVPRTSRKYNMVRGCAALYLLGRIADRDTLSLALQLARDWQGFPIRDFVADELIGNEEEYRFQYLTQALVAAIRIAARYTDMRDEVRTCVHAIVFAPDFQIHTTLKGGACIAYPMRDLIGQAITCMMEDWS